MTIDGQLTLGTLIILTIVLLLCGLCNLGKSRVRKTVLEETMRILSQNTVDSIRIDGGVLKCYMVVTLSSGAEYVVTTELYDSDPDKIYLPNGVTINKNTIETYKRRYLGTGILYSRTHSIEELKNFPVFLVGETETDIKRVYTSELGGEFLRTGIVYEGIVEGKRINWEEDIFDSLLEERIIINNENQWLR